MIKKNEMFKGDFIKSFSFFEQKSQSSLIRVRAFNSPRVNTPNPTIYKLGLFIIWMRKEYPEYTTGEIKEIEKGLKPKDKAIFEAYLKYRSIKAGDKKLNNIKRILIQIYDVSQIGFNVWDLKAFRDFLIVLKNSNKAPSTKNDIKKLLKNFLIEQYKDSGERFNKFRDIDLEDEANREKINAETVPTSQEIETLIRKAESLRWKALIILMYETGARPTEVLSLRWEDIDLHKGIVKLTSTKNKTLRYNPIKVAILHLERYKQEFSYPDIRKTDYVFPSRVNRASYLSVQAVNNYFKELGKTAIKKHFFPYLLRHRRATELLALVSEGKLKIRNYEMFMDHSFVVAKKTYEHFLKENTTKSMIEEIYHIEELTPQEKNEIKRLREALLIGSKNTRLSMEFVNAVYKGDKSGSQRILKEIESNSDKIVQLAGVEAK